MAKPWHASKNDEVRFKSPPPALFDSFAGHVGKVVEPEYSRIPKQIKVCFVIDGVERFPVGPLDIFELATDENAPEEPFVPVMPGE